MYQLQNTNRKFNVFHFYKLKLRRPDELKGIIKFIGNSVQAIPADPEDRPEFFRNIAAAQQYLKNPYRFGLKY